MTVPATTRRAGPFNGNGVTTSFPFTFKVFAAADLEVTLTDVNDVESVLVLNSDYTVTLNPDQDASPGGSIIYSTLATGEILAAVGSLDYDQTLDLPGGGAFSPTALENSLDRTTMQIQQLAEGLSRAVLLPVSGGGASSTLPVPRADFLLGWNSIATALENKDPSDIVSSVAYATARTDIFDGGSTTYVLTSSPGNASALDVSISGVTQVAGVDYTALGTSLAFTSATPAGTGNIAVRYCPALPVGTVDAANVTYDNGINAVPGTAQAKFRERVSVTDFGADPTGGSDSTVALALAAAYLASTTEPPELVFPAGIYEYSVSPNWGISNARIVADGVVRLRYTGTGNAVIIDAGTTAADLRWNIYMGRFIVEGNTGSLNGVFIRSCHHSRFSFNVAGCGNGYSGIRVDFAVCSAFDDPTVSNNEAGWYLGNPITYGMTFASRLPGETVSYCSVNNPVIEGCVLHGIVLEGTLGNSFFGGTSEGNTGWGVYAGAGSNQDKFWGTDFEVNTLGDVIMLGNAVTLHDCESTNYCYVNGSYNRVTGGLYNVLEVGSLGAGCAIDGVTYFRYLGPPQPSDTASPGDGTTFTTTASAAAGTQTLTFAGTKQILRGMRVTGTNIPVDTFVTSPAPGGTGVTTTTVYISNAITGAGVANGAAIKFATSTDPVTNPGVKGTFIDGGTYTHLNNVRNYNTTYNYLTARETNVTPGSIAALANATYNVTVDGVKLGDIARASISYASSALIVNASVTAANTVAVTLFNLSGSAVDPGTISYTNVVVTRPAIL